MRWFALCSFLFFFVIGLQGTKRAYWKNSYREICSIVYTNYYQWSPKLEAWYDGCLMQAEQQHADVNLDSLFHSLRESFETLQISHLQLYDPRAFSSQWRGVQTSSGIVSKWIDGELVVFKVWPDSPAYVAGVRRGDIVKEIKGKSLESRYLSRHGGDLLLSRKGELIELEVRPGRFQRDERLSLSDIDGQVLLTVPTFRGEFFSREEIHRIYRGIEKSPHVIVDLRGNGGGNFVASLRLMSLFFCEAAEVGRIKQHRRQGTVAESFTDDLSDHKQIRQLADFRTIRLQTFKDYPCYKGPVSLLIDEGTGSVAEIFAASMKQRPCSRVLGWPSAGEVVLAIWFPLSFGEDFSLSVPVAEVIMASERKLEGVGVQPDQTLFYDLKMQSLGLDTWVRKASKAAASGPLGHLKGVKTPQCFLQKSRTGV